MSRSGPAVPTIHAFKPSKNLTVTANNLEASNIAKTGNSFESVKCDVKVTSGKWYYEVKLLSGGLFQIGWCTDACKTDAEEGNGIGDDQYSWAYDGNRQKKWHENSVNYGEAWGNGDVIGCAVDFGTRSMSFFRNGRALGVAFSDLPAAVALYPAASLSRAQKCIFNFGKTPLAYPQNGYSTLFSTVSEADKAALEKLFFKYKAVGKPLNASEDPDAPMKAQGSLQFGEDLGVTDMEDPLLLVLAFKLGTKGLWEYTYDEFVGGFSRQGACSLEAIKKLGRQWQSTIPAKSSSSDFKQFYHFTFDYLREDKKILLLDEAVMVWKMLYAGRWALLDKWITFCTSTNMKSVSRDTWQQLYEFIEQHPKDVSNHDPDSSWPVAIDEFVVWMQKNA